MMEFIKTQTGLKLKVNPSEFDSYRLYASLKADPNGFETLAGVQIYIFCAVIINLCICPSALP